MLDEIPLWLAWVVTVGGLLLTFLVSLYESSFFSLRGEDYRTIAGGRERTTRWLTGILEKPHNLAMTLVIQRSVGVAITAIGFLSLVDRLIAPAENHALYAWLIGILFFAGMLIFATEIIPVALADRYRHGIIRGLSGLARLGMILCRPLVELNHLLTKPFRRGAYEGTLELILTRELEGILGSKAEVEALEKGEREMIENVVEMGEKTVREVMIPRVDMRTLEVDTPLPEVVARARKMPHSRIPVYRDVVDAIVGILYVRDLFARMDEEPPPRLSDLLRKAYFIPESKMVTELLAEMKRAKIHMAVVVDEYGGTAGLVTLEDLLEEIVGEINDEYDFEEPLITRNDERTYYVSGKVPISELNAQLGLNLPDVEYDTLSGFIYEQAGAIPLRGTQVEREGVVYQVDELLGHRITKVKIILPGSDKEESE